MTYISLFNRFYKKFLSFTVICILLLSQEGHATAQTTPSPTTPIPSAAQTTTGTTTSTSCAITKVGDPQGDPPVCPTTSLGGGGPTGPCQTAPPANFTTGAEYVSDIQNKWGITFIGFGVDQLVKFREEFYEIDCTGFLQDLRGADIEAWGNDYAQQFSCPGSNATNIKFGIGFTGDFAKALITHELTHMWQFCSERGEKNLLDIQAAFEQEGGISAYSRNECSGIFHLESRQQQYQEDHADTIALYLNPWSGELTCSSAGNPFKTGSYPAHITAAEKGVGKR